MDVVEYIGEWWLPENPENKIHGKLSYDPRKGTTLSLDGAFSESPDEVDFYKIILGDSHGKKITLTNCLQSNLETTWHHDGKQYTTTELVVSVFYVGFHFAKREDIKFSRLSVSYSQLEEWLGERLFHHKQSKNEEGLREHILKFTMPKEKEIILDRFKISIGYGFSTGIGDWRKPIFEANARVSIDVIDEIHIDEFLSILYHLRNFLSLAIGNTISILTITGKNKNMGDFETVQIFYRKEISEERLFPPPFFPFQYKSISERPEFYLQNWFNIIENLEPTYDLFFGTMYNPYLYPTHTFLSLTQALESYLSRTFDNNIMPNELFEEPLSQMLRIINEIPEREHRQQLEPKAKYDMNRKSLRTKLKGLFEEYGNLFTSFINNKDEFIGKVVDTRNYYTHYPPELEERAPKVRDLPFLSQNLRYILIAILLKKIGFDDSFTEQILRRYMRFRIRRIV